MNGTRFGKGNDRATLKIATPEWMDSAACLGADVEAAFPHLVEEAREFIRDNCDRCPVLDECGAYAQRMRCDYGVWGGRLLQKDGDAA